MENYIERVPDTGIAKARVFVFFYSGHLETPQQFYSLIKCKCTKYNPIIYHTSRQEGYVYIVDFVNQFSVCDRKRFLLNNVYPMLWKTVRKNLDDIIRVENMITLDGSMVVTPQIQVAQPINVIAPRVTEAAGSMSPNDRKGDAGDG